MVSSQAGFFLSVFPLSIGLIGVTASRDEFDDTDQPGTDVGVGSGVAWQNQDSCWGRPIESPFTDFRDTLTCSASALCNEAHLGKTRAMYRNNSSASSVRDLDLPIVETARTIQNEYRAVTKAETQSTKIADTLENKGSECQHFEKLYLLKVALGVTYILCLTAFVYRMRHLLPLI